MMAGDWAGGFKIASAGQYKGGAAILLSHINPPLAPATKPPVDILLSLNAEDSYGAWLVLRGRFGGLLGRAPYCAAGISRGVTLPAFPDVGP